MLKDYIAMFFTAAAVALSGCADADISSVPGPSSTDDIETSSIVFELNDNMEVVTFEKKVDGDTADFKRGDGSIIRVRFLAVDTPETVKAGTEVQEYGPEASAYTETRLSEASQIYLEWDDGSDTQDKYDRYLAWIWVDGSLLEEELVSQGLAQVAYIYGDYRYTDALYAVQEQAQQDQVGIWSSTNDQ